MSQKCTKYFARYFLQKQNISRCFVYDTVRGSCIPNYHKAKIEIYFVYWVTTKYIILVITVLFYSSKSKMYLLFIYICISTILQFQPSLHNTRSGRSWETKTTKHSKWRRNSKVGTLFKEENIDLYSLVLREVICK